MKKLMVILLALLLAISSVAAVAEEELPLGLTPFTDTVVLRIGQSIDPSETFPDGQTIEDNLYTRQILDTLNIKIEVAWYVAESDKDQKINLAIASNDLPDAMVVNAAQFNAMRKADQLADLTEVYEKYAIPSMREIYSKNDGAALKAATYDGKLLALPSVTTSGDGYHTMWIRKDWLDQLGLEVPKTVDEVEVVAKAFVDAKLGGENTIGIIGPASGGHLYADFLASTNNIYGLDPIFSAMGAYPGYWIKDEDGNVVYGSTTSETRAALERIAEMYKEGIIDPEIGVRKESAEAVISGQAGIFFGTWWMSWSPLTDALRINPEANWQCYAVPLNDESRWTPHMGSPTNQYLVIRKGYEHPEVAVMLTNNNLTMDTIGGGVENGMPVHAYPARVVLSQPDECQYNAKFMVEFLAGERTLEEIDPNIYNVLLDACEHIYETKLEPYDNYDIQYWDTSSSNWGRGYATLVGCLPLVEAESYTDPVYSLTYAQTETMGKRWTNLKRLEDETFLKIIVGNAPIETFDSFVDEWKKQGGDTITAEVADIAG